MFPPEKPHGVHHFIDRHSYSQHFQHLLRHQNVVQVIGDTFGEYGLGKTTMLSKLYADIARYDDLHPIWLSLSRFSPNFHNPRFSDRLNTLDMLVKNLLNYHQLIIDLCQSNFPRANLRAEIERSSLEILATLPAVEIKEEAGIDQWADVIDRVVPLGNLALPTQVSETDFRAAVESAVDAITRIFVAEYNRHFGVKRTVIFADDYCWISDQPIGDWVMKNLGDYVDNSVMIVSRTTPILTADPERVRPLRLTNFTPEDVGLYLEKRLHVDHLPDHLVENVYHFTRGHAQRVCLVADLLLAGKTDDDVLPAFPRITEGDEKGMVRNLVRELLHNTRFDWLREALEIGAIVRRFDGPMMRHLLLENAEHVSRVESLTPEDIIVELEKYSFVDYYHDDLTGVYFAFHNFVAEQIQALLQAESPDYFQELHQRVADYYQSILDGYAEQEDGSALYVQLYRFEDVRWQRVTQEWLYHITYLDDRKEAQFQFVSTYMTAFQWWGFYLPFPFCEQLIRQWELTQTEEDAHLFELVQRFHQAHPLGSPREKIGAEGWLTVRSVLETLFAYFDLNKDYKSLDEDRLWLRINMLELYAATFRFHRPADFDEAEAVYRQAAEMARYSDDDYNESYFLAYIAEMMLEKGDYEGAIATAAAGREVLGAGRPFNPDMDYEALSLTYMVTGDALLRLGRFDEAAANYVEALLGAYAFNFIQIPIPPDPYTVKWNDDLSQDIIHNLIDAWHAGHATQVETIAERLRTIWELPRQLFNIESHPVDLSALFAARDEMGLRAYLLPPPVDLKASGDLVYLENIADVLRALLTTNAPEDPTPTGQKKDNPDAAPTVD